MLVKSIRLLTMLMLLGPLLETAEAVTVTYSGNTNTGNSFIRPGRSSGDFQFHIQPFHVDTDSTYDLFSYGQTSDGYIFLYRDTFDPANPNTNLLAANDDAPCCTQSLIPAFSLQAGTQYYYVTSQYSTGYTITFTNDITGLGTAALEFLWADAGLTPNQQAIIASTGAITDQDVIVFLAGAGSPDDLSPEPYAGLQESGRRVSRAGMATVGERMESLRLTKTAGIDGQLRYAAAAATMTDTGPAAAVTGKDGYSVWARPYRYSADQDRNGSFFGYRHDLFGVTVGADRAIGENAVAGLLFGKSGGTVEYSQVSANTDVESVYAGIYGALQNGDYALHAQAAWFMHEFDTVRNLGGMTATSTHDAEEVAVSIGGEYLGYQTGGWSVVPGATLEFSRYREDGFTESGAGAFDLIGDSVSDNGLATRLGVRINKAFVMEKNVLIPELQVEWRHELGDTDRDVTARFAGAGAGAFTVDGVPAERNSALVGLSATSIFNDTSALFVNYDNEFASDYHSWGVSFGFKYSF